MITLTITKPWFNALKRILGNVNANDGYFAHRQLKAINVPANATTVTIEMTKEQYVGLRTALSRPTVNEAGDMLDIIFAQGEPQLTAIFDAEQKEREAAVAAQTGLKDVKEAKVQSIKPKVKVKATSRKA